MRGRGLEHRVSTHSRTGNDESDVASAAGVACSFVEDDEDRCVFDAEERGDEVAEPMVARRDRAVVHVVAEVGDDERVRRELARVEALEGKDVRGAAGKVEKREVFLRESA